MRANEIYEAAGLSPREIADMPSYIDGIDEFYRSTAFDKLYDYFAFQTCEMPYGTAKARTGDPDLWILEKIDQ